MSYYFPPSELDFIKCKRCYYIKKIKKLEYRGTFPQVFNDFDRDQKNYFISKNANVLSEKLPKGNFFTTVTKDDMKERKKNNLTKLSELELPTTIKSKELKDKKKRTFAIAGKPDLVIKFDKGYGILDFKTTGEIDKTKNYKYQLEAYAQILENPDNDTPKLSPITLIGLIQFTPEKIISHDSSSVSQKMKMQYFSIDRNKDDFYNRITELIDILEKKQVPVFDARCELCNYSREIAKL